MIFGWIFLKILTFKRVQNSKNVDVISFYLFYFYVIMGRNILSINVINIFILSIKKRAEFKCCNELVRWINLLIKTSITDKGFICHRLTTLGEIIRLSNGFFFFLSTKNI